MILERVESEHIETAEEIVYNFCFGWNIICLHKDGNMRFTEIWEGLFLFGFLYSLAQLDSRLKVLVHSFAVAVVSSS